MLPLIITRVQHQTTTDSFLGATGDDGDDGGESFDPVTA